MTKLTSDCNGLQNICEPGRMPVVYCSTANSTSVPMNTAVTKSQAAEHQEGDQPLEEHHPHRCRNSLTVVLGNVADAVEGLLQLDEPGDRGDEHHHEGDGPVNGRAISNLIERLFDGRPCGGGEIAFDQGEHGLVGFYRCAAKRKNSPRPEIKTSNNGKNDRAM